jgi:hypothetical protein
MLQAIAAAPSGGRRFMDVDIRTPYRSDFSQPRRRPAIDRFRSATALLTRTPKIENALF